MNQYRKSKVENISDMGEVENEKMLVVPLSGGDVSVPKKLAEKISQRQTKQNQKQ